VEAVDLDCERTSAALIHSSFTTLVREAGDLSAGVFDARDGCSHRQ
jgi:hypothetical protein